MVLVSDASWHGLVDGAEAHETADLMLADLFLLVAALISIVGS